jgi:alkyl sulfatase BDS1-like metallo-beta-lactamase superfamily hydrolase
MATEQECEQALTMLAERIASADAGTKHNGFDRTLSCTLPDLDLTYAGQLRSGRLENIRKTDSSAAQVRLTMSSDDLVALVAGRLGMASAWATGRVKIDAGMRDMLRLRSIF